MTEEWMERDSQDSFCIQTREKMMKTFTSVLILGILVMLLADSCAGVPACGPDDDGGVDGMEDTRFGCPTVVHSYKSYLPTPTEQPLGLNRCLGKRYCRFLVESKHNRM